MLCLLCRVCVCQWCLFRYFASARRCCGNPPKWPAAGQRRPNLKILAQELMRSGRSRADVLDRVMPKPLPRLPSYDPEAGDSPTGSATFVICVDGDENVSLLVNRQANAKSNGVRRVACAFSSVLVGTRSWMLPEARRPLTRRARMR
jgi:hypothetical protein